MSRVLSLQWVKKMTREEWYEVREVYGKYFNRWLKKHPPDEELSAAEWWMMFKHWFYNIREDENGKRVSLPRAQKGIL